MVEKKIVGFLVLAYLINIKKPATLAGFLVVVTFNLIMLHFQ